ncbi:MAG: 50S ribosomal protein L3, partial [Rhodospirillaceae bacterium]|nr:50S ribosomal protein L3 [Rhodospirillaceae bacterium]
DHRVTIQNLRVVQTDLERGLILIRGAVPGAKGSYVLIQDAVKRASSKDVPYPAALAGGAPAETPAESGEAEGTEASEA